MLFSMNSPGDGSMTIRWEYTMLKETIKLENVISRW